MVLIASERSSLSVNSPTMQWVLTSLAKLTYAQMYIRTYKEVSGGSEPYTVHPYTAHTYLHIQVTSNAPGTAKSALLGSR